MRASRAGPLSVPLPAALARMSRASVKRGRGAPVVEASTSKGKGQFGMGAGESAADNPGAKAHAGLLPCP